MNSLLLFTIASLLSVSAASTSEAVSSSEAASASTETLFQQKLDSHIAGVENQLRVLDALLENYYKDYNYTEADANDYVSNPINTYMLIKRTAVEWPAVRKVVFDPKMDEELKEIEELAKKMQEEKNSV